MQRSRQSGRLGHHSNFPADSLILSVLDEVRIALVLSETVLVLVIEMGLT
jgi:hypothetical protein